MHVIAAKAVAFGEALQPDSRAMPGPSSPNAKALAAAQGARRELVAGGTDTHLALVDLGRSASPAGCRRGAGALRITCNKNGVPFDPLPPIKTSGIRVGSPAGTTRGFGVQEFRDIGDMIADVLEGLRTN
jgi:glycine hydroxymethyltransferase